MIINCDKCGKKYKIDESKITKDQAKYKCRACNNMIVVTLVETLDIDEFQFTSVEDSDQRRKKQERPRVEKPAEKAITKIKWYDSIQFKMAAIIILLTTIIFAAFVFSSYRRTKNRMDTELNQLASVSTERLSRSLLRPLWDLDDKQMKDSISSEMMERRIYAILVKDTDGKTILSGWKRNKKWKIVEAKKPIQGEFVKASKKIIKDGEFIGTVETYIASRFLREDFRRSVYDILITGLVLILSILVAVILTFRNLLIQPIMKLTNAAAQMSVGDLNVKIGVKSKNEIGLLAGAIERMQESLRMAMDRLRQRSAV